MTRITTIRAAALLSLAALAGCVTLPPAGPTIATDARLLAGQAEREAQLQQARNWTLEGRIGVSNARDSRGDGSGSLIWRQQGNMYDFNVNGGFGYHYRLSGDADGATLEGVDKAPIRGVSAQQLMLRAVGWTVPLADLRAWVLGLRANGSPAQLSFGTNQLPAVIEQDGWRVEYRAWDTSRTPPLPSKVFAEKPPYKVRLSIQSWALQ